MTWYLPKRPFPVPDDWQRGMIGDTFPAFPGLIEEAAKSEEVSQAEREALYERFPFVRAVPPGGPKVGLRKDANGYFVHSNRVRSKSYPSIEAIPKSAVEYIESTG